MRRSKLCAEGRPSASATPAPHKETVCFHVLVADKEITSLISAALMI